MNAEWTIGRRGFWKPYYWELRVKGELIDSARFWTLKAVMLSIASYEAS